jgi:hypothetical protein
MASGEIVVPEDMPPAEIVRGIVAYLRKEAAAFDHCISEGEALGEDMRWAKVKRMSVGVMAERVGRGDWLRQASADEEGDPRRITLDDASWQKFCTSPPNAALRALFK